MVGRNMSLKHPVTTPGIDSGTVRLVVQRLNHYATPGPPVTMAHMNSKEADAKQRVPKCVQSMAVEITERGKVGNTVSVDN